MLKTSLEDADLEAHPDVYMGLYYVTVMSDMVPFYQQASVHSLLHIYPSVSGES